MHRIIRRKYCEREKDQNAMRQSDLQACLFANQHGLNRLLIPLLQGLGPAFGLHVLGCREAFDRFLVGISDDLVTGLMKPLQHRLPQHFLSKVDFIRHGPSSPEIFALLCQSVGDCENKLLVFYHLTKMEQIKNKLQALSFDFAGFFQIQRPAITLSICWLKSGNYYKVEVSLGISWQR